MFRGHFRHTIDPKGRLSIPAKFREVLREAGSDRLVMAPNGTGLDVYPEDKWRELEERVNGLAKLDPDRRRFQHVYLSAGLDVVLDPHGRIQILQDYRERGGLSKNVVIIGMMDHFEVWDDDRWTIYQREQAGPFDDLRARLAEKGVAVHVGEWGCYSKTPHEVALAWMADYLALWKEAGWGWALWNLRGDFGVLDSNRADVRYEDYKGHKLDRKMLELLRSS